MKAQITKTGKKFRTRFMDHPGAKLAPCLKWTLLPQGGNWELPKCLLLAGMFLLSQPWKKRKHWLRRHHLSSCMLISDQVSSTSLEERHWALGSLSRLVLEDPSAYTVVSQDDKCLGQLVKALADPEIEIRVSASGLLRYFMFVWCLPPRNLTNVADESLCNKLIERDCLTSCCEMVKRYFTFRMF